MSAGRVFDWQECLDAGADGEFRTARYLEAAGYKIKPEGQHNGVWKDSVVREYDHPDMRVVSHASGVGKEVKPLIGALLDVKTDSMAHETGNCVIELLSNVGTGRPGWVYTTKADFIVWLLAGNGKVIIVETTKLREALKGWRKGRIISQLNEMFMSTAMLVPVSSLEAIAFHCGWAK